MKKAFSSLSHFTPFLLCLSLLILVGCASIQPLTSTPPRKSIYLSKPLVVGDGLLMAKTTVPAGTYRATMEDAGGYYFEGSRKLIVDGVNLFSSTLASGGLYWKKGESTYTHVYWAHPGDYGGTVKQRIPSKKSYSKKSKKKSSSTTRRSSSSRSK